MGQIGAVVWLLRAADGFRAARDLEADETIIRLLW